jgi:dipeptidyl-peptidase-3
MSTDSAELSSHLVRVQDVTCAQLDCSTAFAGLSQQEALYAMHIHDASWAGAFICARQTSAEAVPLLCLLRLVWEGGYAPVAAALEAACGRDTLERFLAFSVEVISNLGNYKSFGDTKLVPDLPEAAFVALVRASPAYAAGHGALLEELWAALEGLLYSLAPRLRSLGLGADKGVSCYYSSDVTPAEAGLAHRWLASLGLAQAYNSRLFAVKGQGGERVLQLRLASAAPAGASPEAVADAPLRALLQAGVVAYEGALVQCVRGDHAPLMARVCSALQAAAPHAANATQRAMLARYVESFDSGSMAAHMAGSAEWVADKGPAVESYLGFIESYQDPMGISGAWEGFVAVVNKETSKKFGALVAGATSLLPLLPWGPEYEKESFSKPDFTALEVLAFASGGVPAGINIPVSARLCVNALTRPAALLTCTPPSLPPSPEL